MLNNILIQCGDHFENQNRILPLVIHFRTKGYTPYVLCYDKQSSSRLFEEEGINVIYLSEFRESNGLKYKKITIPDKYFEDIIKVEKLKFPWKFDSYQKIKKERFKVGRDFHGIKKILVLYKIKSIGIWNGYTGYVANILRLLSCEDAIPGFYMERSFFDGGLFVDVLGVNGESKISGLEINEIKELSLYKDRVETGFFEEKKNYDLTDPSVFNEADYKVFLPLQVQSDTNNILYSPYVKTTRRLILLAIEAVRKINDSFSLNGVLIVREHPEEIDKNLNLPIDETTFYYNEGDIKDLVLSSDLILTVNSTVGLEALKFNRPLVTLGRSIYSGKGLTLDSTDAGLTSAFERVLINGWAPNSEDIVLYFDFLFRYNTASKFNFPECISDCYQADNYLEYSSRVDHVYKRLKENLSGKKSLKLVFCSAELPVINFTYRKNAIFVSYDFLYDRLKKNSIINETQSLVIERPRCDCVYSDYDIVVVARSYEKYFDFGLLENVLDEYLVPYNK